MRRFWSDNKGNIGILFALAMIPVIGGMGAAIDYSMANAYRTDMQKALDSTALALTRLMPASQATLNEKGMQYFSASMGQHKLTGLTLTITPESGIIKLAAKGYYEPSVAGVLGVNNFEVGARSEAKWGIGKVEVVLALDNTGSMASSGKLTQLKLAAHNLLDTLQASAKNPGDAKIGIVPFGVQVRVDAATYMNNNLLRWDSNVGDCSKSQYLTKTSCQSNGGTWTSATTANWTGCIADRDKDTNLNYDVNDTTPVSTTDNTKFPRTVGCGSLATVMPLNYNWGTTSSNDPNTLHGKINQMQAVGNTNVTIGLVWAWHLLSPTAMFTEGVAYGTPNLQKYIILLTDGENTENRFSNSQSAIDARTTAACNNIKALKDANGNPYIKIYTIRVIDGNANLLKSCATNESMYYDVQNAAQLSSVFSAIGSEIANLHLAK